MVEYHLRQSVSSLVACLYSPNAKNPFSTETLGNYVNDCAWQLEQGERPKRILFHIAPALADAEKEIDRLNKILQDNRRDKQTCEQGELSQLLQAIEEEQAEQL